MIMLHYASIKELHLLLHNQFDKSFYTSMFMELSLIAYNQQNKGGVHSTAILQ